MDPAAVSSASPRQRLWRNVRRIGVLVLLILGALGGYQIWQISLAKSSFVVVLEQERDVTGEGNQSLVTTAQLLSMMDYTIGLSRDGTVLQTVPGGRRQAVAVTVRGRALRTELESGRIFGFLHVRGAEPDRLRLDLSPATVEGDTLRQVLEHAQADQFLASPITTLVAVRNQHDDPVPGLVDRWDRMREDPARPGVYTIGILTEDLFLARIDSVRTEEIQADAGESHFQLEVPLEWFVAATAGEHVVRVEEITTPVRLSPEPRGVSPAAVTDGLPWSGQLQLVGRNLDLVITARLQGASGTVDCHIVDRRGKALTLRVDPSRLAVGTYDVVLEGAGAPEDVRLAKAFRVRPGLRLTQPREGATVRRDTPLEIRWDAGGRTGNVLIEGTSDAAGGAWMEIYRGPVDKGFQVWDLSVLGPADEGTYRLRMTLLDQDQIPPVERTIQIAAPQRVTIKLRFQLGARRYGMIKSIRIDDEPVDTGGDPALVTVSLPLGRHSLRAEGPLVQPYVGTFEVTEEGQIVDVELQQK